MQGIGAPICACFQHRRVQGIGAPTCIHIRYRTFQGIGAPNTAVPYIHVEDWCLIGLQHPCVSAEDWNLSVSKTLYMYTQGIGTPHMLLLHSMTGIGTPACGHAQGIGTPHMLLLHSMTGIGTPACGHYTW